MTVLCSIPNVCWVVAAKDSTGEYIPEQYVFTDVEEAVQHACALIDEDPTSDPRMVQVILDPEHPALRMIRTAEKVKDVLAGERNLHVRQGLQEALDLLEEEGGLLELDELEEGGKS